MNINVVKNLPKKTALVKAFQHLWSLLTFLRAQNQISSKGVRSDQSQITQQPKQRDPIGQGHTEAPYDIILHPSIELGS